MGKKAHNEPLPHAKQGESKKLANNKNSGAKKLFLWFFVIMFGFSLYLLFQIVHPFINAIILACIFAALCFPFYVKALVWLKGKRISAALLVIFSLAVLVAIPISIFVISLVPQAAKSISSVNQWLSSQDLGGVISTYIEPVLKNLDMYFPGLDISSTDIRGTLLSASRATGQTMLSLGTYIFANAVNITMNFLLVLAMMFYLLMNGASIVKKIEYLFPLKPSQTSVIIESLRKMSKAVFVGGLFVAALQGLVGGIGLSCVGISGMFWGTVMVFAALVPVIGTGLIWIPATLYLYFTGEHGGALFLLLWCGILVAGIDSILRPILMKDGAKVPVLFLFLAIFGGVQAFGMLGLLYGPLILGFVTVMISIYNEEFHDILSTRSMHNEASDKEISISNNEISAGDKDS